MATYSELKDLQKNSDLQDKVEIAGWVWAQAVLVEAGTIPNHDKRVTMARRIFTDTLSLSRVLLPAVLAANADVEVSAITGASDTQVQGAVDSILDAYATDLKVAGTE